MEEFLNHLKETMEDFFNTDPKKERVFWAVNSVELEDGYIIKTEMGTKTTTIKDSEVPYSTSSLVTWAFSPDGKAAYIKLPKPLDFAMFTAELMGGNLFGTGLCTTWLAKQPKV